MVALQNTHRTLKRQAWLDKFLHDQELPVLSGAGHVRADDAKAHAEGQYALFHARRLALEAEADTESVAALENAAKQAEAAQKKRRGGRS